MVNKEFFLKMMSLAEAYDSEVDKWNEFGLDIFDKPLVEIPWKFFHTWIENTFDKEGKEWIEWYMWERISIFTKEILPCYDENDKEFFVNTPEDLWPLVENHRKLNLPLENFQAEIYANSN